MSKMPIEFFDWLDECPVQWFKIGDDADGVTYEFSKQGDEDEDDN